MSVLLRCYRTLLVCGLPIWLMAAAWPGAMFAQFHELPPSNPAPPATLPYDTKPSPWNTGAAPLSPSFSGSQIQPGGPDQRRPYYGGPALADQPGSPSSALGTFPGQGGDGLATAHSHFDPNTCASEPNCYGPYWTWQVVPDGLMYKSYLAGPKEPRMGTDWVYVKNVGWVWDTTLGGRVGLLRYGSDDSLWPEGWQLDFEGAAFPRLDLANDHFGQLTSADRDLIESDYRVGVPLTYRNGPWEAKFAYYHLCAHLGDEFSIVNVNNPTFNRINYVRDALVLGIALRPHRDWRFYGEAAWAFHIEGGAEPWEFQFGAEYSPADPTGAAGTPFVAANGHLRQDNHFAGNFNFQAGWQWRGRSGHLLRFGGQYFNGMSEEYQFYAQSEQQVGLGLWYDF